MKTDNLDHYGIVKLSTKKKLNEILFLPNWILNYQGFNDSIKFEHIRH